MSDTTKPCRDTKQLSAQAQKACALFMQKCQESGLNVLITETYRSQERQNYLYEQGRTRPGQIVTWTKSSNHTGRNAWDICKNVKGQEYDDKIFFKEAGIIAKSLGITWGGTWSTPDTPHFEIDKNWKEPATEDLEYKKSVSVLAQEINVNNTSWYPLDKVNIKNVPALLRKMGGIDKLYTDGVIGNKLLWEEGEYQVNHVRSLIIKYASRLG